VGGRVLVLCGRILGLEQPFEEQPVAQFDMVMKINVYGVYHFHQAVIPHMTEGGWGRCVTITSGARNEGPNQVAYCVSKGAVYSFIGALGNTYSKLGCSSKVWSPGGR
jgi:3-oxoacyl-[acyl-carrier protein] reductase